MSENTPSTALAESPQQAKALSLWSNDTTKEKIKALIPPSMSFDRFNRLTTSLILRNPRIAECEPVSFFSVISDCATIGVYPDPVTGLAYVIPRFNKKKGVNEATLIVGYKGLRAIALRSPEILDLWTGIVREGDEFELRRAPRMELIHKEDPRQLGEVIGYYSIAALKNGMTSYEWMPVVAMNKMRDAALAGLEDWKVKSSPWTLHEEEMGRKTVLRRHFKSLPLRVEDQEAIQKEMDRDEDGLKFAEKVDEKGEPTSEIPARTPRPERKSGVKAAVADAPAPMQPPVEIGKDETPTAPVEVVEDAPPAKPVSSDKDITPQPAPVQTERGAPGGSQQQAVSPKATPAAAPATKPAPAPAKQEPAKPTAPAPKQPSQPTWPMSTIGHVLTWKGALFKGNKPGVEVAVETEHYTGKAYAGIEIGNTLKQGLERDEESSEQEPTFSGESVPFTLSLEQKGTFVIITKAEAMGAEKDGPVF